MWKIVRITRSFLFPLICLCEIGLQVLIIYIGKSPFHIVNEGFTGEQWGICIGFSAVTFVVSFLVKLIPIHLIIDKFIGHAEEKEEDNKNDISEKTEKEKNEDKISNGAEKNSFKKENNWDSERSQKEIIYKKDN